MTPATSHVMGTQHQAGNQPEMLIMIRVQTALCRRFLSVERACVLMGVADSAKA